MVDTLCIIYYNKKHNRHYSVCYRLTRQKHEERDYINVPTGGMLSSLFTRV